jgi:hypothetical protein
MIEITVDPKAQNPKAEACKLIIQHGKTLADGAKVEILFSGGLIGHLTITRVGVDTPEDTLILSGMLDGQKVRRYPVPLRWAGAMPAQNTYNPDAAFVGMVRSEASITDLYEGGARFSSEGCPRAKSASDLSFREQESAVAGKALNDKARAELAKFLKTLPPDVAKGLKPRGKAMREAA